jgi:hypothetical protein
MPVLCAKLRDPQPCRLLVVQARSPTDRRTHGRGRRARRGRSDRDRHDRAVGQRPVDGPGRQPDSETVTTGTWTPSRIRADGAGVDVAEE